MSPGEDFVVGALAGAVVTFVLTLVFIGVTPPQHFNMLRHDQNLCALAKGVLLQDVSGHYACVNTSAMHYWHETHFYGDEE
jgi:hypothetical protein